ncbi:unnamed protein product [Rotaria sp. Silwood2]|nr:unnamed protein product [Rotaria sp. Silwood2]CAF4196503.1 unnamed protein product [Rotaria sp. Silwood2]
MGFVASLTEELGALTTSANTIKEKIIIMRFYSMEKSSPFDIHTGPLDLKFPHHANEIALSQAYDDNVCCIGYFLFIFLIIFNEDKTSTSSKEIITITNALEDYHTDDIRLLFLLNDFEKPLDFNNKIIEEITEYKESIKSTKQAN